LRKLKIVIALFFYLLSLVHVIDWIHFWNQHKALALENHTAFKLKYFNHFPEYIQPILTANSRVEGFILTLSLIVSGIILTREKSIVFRIIGINAFVFAAWFLFGLM
jgi:hypothetical protein